MACPSEGPRGATFIRMKKVTVVRHRTTALHCKSAQLACVHGGRLPSSPTRGELVFSTLMGEQPPAPGKEFDVVVVAASLGGREVLESIIARLPRDFPAPVVIVH